MALALITGSCGLVGSESSEFFSRKGFEILGIDNNSRRKFFGKDGDINWVKNRLKKNLKNYKHFNLDITNYKDLEKIFRKYKKNIKLVIHSAAQPSHDWAKTNIFKDFDINAKGTINLLELTKKYCYDAPFIFMSTNKVYGDNQNIYYFWSINGLNWSMNMLDGTGIENLSYFIIKHDILYQKPLFGPFMSKYISTHIHNIPKNMVTVNMIKTIVRTIIIMQK